ncbi:MAG: DUF2795 domain-containing protein [Streptosporangiales bacterium]|nr:DUF2795 domain-containing protein [Streptosporangiales bacterium]
MQQRGDKHGPLQDENLKGETQGLERADRETRAEEWRAQEPPGEDQPEADRASDDMLTGAVPPGMTSDDVEGRSEIARFLNIGAFPADRDTLVDVLVDNDAPGHIVDLARRLPGGREFRNMQEAWEALGGGVERRRT